MVQIRNSIACRCRYWFVYSYLASQVYVPMPMRARTLCVTRATPRRIVLFIFFFHNVNVLCTCLQSRHAPMQPEAEARMRPHTQSNQSKTKSVKTLISQKKHTRHDTGRRDILAPGIAHSLALPYRSAVPRVRVPRLTLGCKVQIPIRVFSTNTPGGGPQQNYWPLLLGHSTRSRSTRKSQKQEKNARGTRCAVCDDTAPRGSGRARRSSGRGEGVNQIKSKVLTKPDTSKKKPHPSTQHSHRGHWQQTVRHEVTQAWGAKRERV